MNITKYFDERNRYRKEDTPIVYDDESWTRDTKREYSCKWCHRVLKATLIDSSGQNPALYCDFCSIEQSPEETRLKEQVKVPSGVNKTPLVTNKFTEPQLKRKKAEPRGTFKTLQDRGVRITNYSERGWRKVTYDGHNDRSHFSTTKMV